MRFYPAYIPPSITTFEQLIIWASLALAAVHPGVTAVEAADRVSPVIDIRPYYIPADLQEDDRFVGRISFAVRQGYTSGPQWEYVKELSDKQPMDSFVEGDVLPRT